jgi:hypothetical protein
MLMVGGCLGVDGGGAVFLRAHTPAIITALLITRQVEKDI